MSQKTCKKCGKLGHNARTCGKVRVIKVPQFKRRCHKCGNLGHNARTCGKVPHAEAPDETTERKTLVEKGREILEQEAVKAPRVPIDGTKPQKGLWLVNPTTKRCAGIIAYVRKAGDIVWRDFYGVFVESNQATVATAGYKYAEEKPIGDDWVYLHLGGWEKSPKMREAVFPTDTLTIE